MNGTPHTGKAICRTAIQRRISTAIANTLRGYIGGKARQMAEIQGTVKQILLLALFFSFIVLAAQFNSLRLPFIVLLAAPFCLAGMGYGLALANQPFGATVPVLFGFAPLAFAWEEGGELLRPMAAAAMGGIAVELFVALFLFLATHGEIVVVDEVVAGVVWRVIPVIDLMRLRTPDLGGVRGWV